MSDTSTVNLYNLTASMFSLTSTGSFAANVMCAAHTVTGRLYFLSKRVERNAIEG